MIADAASPEEVPVQVAAPPAETPGDAAAPGPAAEDEKGLLGALAADERIRSQAERHERTLWASAFVVTLIYAGVIAAQVMGLGGLSALEREMAEREKERRGQDSNSISVELVPDPDKDSKTKRWQEGMQSPSPAPPQPQQSPSQPQPEVKAPPTEQQAEEEAKQEAEKEAEQDKQGGEPTLPSLEALVDAAADNLSQQIKRHYEKKPQQATPQRQAMYSGGGMQVRGMGASGKSDEFSKSVIAALLATRPGPFALWGRVLVSFQINPRGELAYVHVLQSSGNRALDQAAVDAIRKARFDIPPPDLSPDARTYIIDYIFG